MRPFLLYHWSPAGRRARIMHAGLCPRRLSVDGIWRPYLCFARFPTAAWALSATHSGRPGDWDLWCCWSDHVGPFGPLHPAQQRRAPEKVLAPDRVPHLSAHPEIEALAGRHAQIHAAADK